MAITSKNLLNQPKIIQNEWFELNQQDFDDLLFTEGLTLSGATLRSKLQLLVKSNKASFTTSSNVVSSVSQNLSKTNTKSFEYQQDFDLPEITPKKTNSKSEIIQPKHVRYPDKTWGNETRDLGSSISLLQQPATTRANATALTIDANSTKLLPSINYGTLDLSSPAQAKEDKQTKPFSYSLPSFSHMQLQTTLNLADSKWQLVASHTPFDKEGNRLSNRRVIHFVRSLELPQIP